MSDIICGYVLSIGKVIIVDKEFTIYTEELKNINTPSYISLEEANNDYEEIKKYLSECFDNYFDKGAE